MANKDNRRRAQVHPRMMSFVYYKRVGDENPQCLVPTEESYDLYSHDHFTHLIHPCLSQAVLRIGHDP